MKNLSGKTKYNLKILLIILIIYMLLVIAAAVIIDERHAELVMLGDEMVQVKNGSIFDDPGAYAYTQGRLFGKGRYLKVKAKSNLNTGISGTYTVTYSTKYFGKTLTETRTVVVLDNEAPTIILYHTDDYTPTWMTGYEEEGYEAVDNLDGDLTGLVQRTVMESAVVYSVTDSSGNQTSVTRELPTMVKPEIQLNGGNSFTITAGTEYRDPGYTAVDAADNDLSGSVTVSGEVNSAEPGIYELNYTLTNSAGDTVSAVRTIEVTAEADETVMPEARTIYLTFDDGPGPYTAQLLDVLKAYDVKATFFVTNDYPDNIDMIGRAWDEGHTIAVHTYCHDYYTVYASEDAYMSDFNAMENIIYEQTGSYTSLFRFPGGSSNTVSRFNPGIMTTLAADMTAMGYKYFDWNVDSDDAGNAKTTAEVYKNIIDGISGEENYAIVLQHDVKDFSVAAVEQVIQWGLSNGYTFATLDATSPGAHHRIAN